ncbi:hypothetical protein QT970_06960 [Microcoleus sp. herbarium8]|uniref:hypothetical protein n=1 Tax=unclassified Microcoleus TaxID=2642155 RepID=UPI002FD3A9C1
MKTINLTHEFAEIQISTKHLTTLINAGAAVVDNISQYEIHARIGVFIEEFKAFFELLSLVKSQLNLDNSKNIKQYILTFSYDDLLLLNQTLNEVCNGFFLQEFESQIGVPREEAYLILMFTNELIEKMESNCY